MVKISDRMIMLIIIILIIIITKFKLLEPTEIGKMFCLLGLAKALMKMIGGPLFSLLYKVACF